MNGRSHQKQTYDVARPLTPEQLIIRVRDRPDRAVEALANYDSSELSHLICVVVGLGYAISFSATSDGGAISISTYDGHTRIKCYGRSTSQLEESILELLRRVRGDE